MQNLRRVSTAISLHKIAYSPRNNNFPHLRTLSTLLKPPSPPPSPTFNHPSILPQPSITFFDSLLHPSRTFCSRSPPNTVIDDSEVPAAIDYSSVLQENEFHKLADSTIYHLLEKLEEYGDSIDVDGFDIDYGNEVLTLRLGDLGTYVVNKQTPNRQIWLSSPVSGPSRFDWDRSSQAWVYRRNKANLYTVLESELEKLCGEPVNLS